MSAQHDPQAWTDHNVVDRDGDKIGKLDGVYVDDRTGRPEWGAVSTGVLGMGSVKLVPLTAARFDGEEVRVPYEKSHVKDAPDVGDGDHVTVEEEAALFSHYELAYEPEERGAATGGDDAMTRSEEELRVGKADRERGRARLRKHVVTEDVERTVPVRREEARIEREPITDENVEEATRGPEISEADHEVVLHEEEPVVEKRAVPKERVRLGKEGVTEERRIEEEVRREEIEAENAGERRRR